MNVALVEYQPSGLLSQLFTVEGKLLFDGSDVFNGIRTVNRLQIHKVQQHATAFKVTQEPVTETCPL